MLLNYYSLQLLHKFKSGIFNIKKLHFKKFADNCILLHLSMTEISLLKFLQN